ncbi:unnamed protein product [Protopolystoma xenopodis]|uniref:Uncharacterized protein n=1 Tax=Protopolystoma xenopodis TaxID=117903 RepID=A0A448WMH0_9PLAT|nr:unnamed protein product [Protopolystoma xenopodis]
MGRVTCAIQYQIRGNKTVSSSGLAVPLASSFLSLSLSPPFSAHPSLSDIPRTCTICTCRQAVGFRPVHLVASVRRVFVQF